MIRLSESQRVRVACFGCGLNPFVLIDQSERLPREATRLPPLDCSANRRCSEVDSDAQHTAAMAPRKTNRRIRRGAKFFRRPQVEIVLFATGRDRCFATADVYYGVTARCNEVLPYLCCANGARFTFSLGSAPGIMQNPTLGALKARFMPASVP